VVAEQWHDAWARVPFVRLPSFVVTFDCPCGARDFWMSEDNDSKVCDCGRQYRIKAIFEMMEPSDGQP
jgi:hypothetical protein